MNNPNGGPDNPEVEYLVDDKRITESVAALSTIEDLKGFTEEELTWPAAHGTERFCNDGDLIFSQGTPPHHLMFILSGEVLVHRHSSSPVSILIRQTGRIKGKTPFDLPPEISTNVSWSSLVN